MAPEVHPAWEGFLAGLRSDVTYPGDPGTVIHKDSFFPCYRAEDGLVKPGPVTLGRDVVVGEAIEARIATLEEQAFAGREHLGRQLLKQKRELSTMRRILVRGRCCP